MATFTEVDVSLFATRSVNGASAIDVSLGMLVAEVLQVDWAGISDGLCILTRAAFESEPKRKVVARTALDHHVLLSAVVLVERSEA